MNTLGLTLKNARESNSFTLRQVEDSVGISNAYLSQLENDKIKSPSAHVLYKLANLYKVDLNDLLSETGIIHKNDASKDTKGSNLDNRIALSSKSLTEKDKDNVLEYIRFLKSKNDR
jgi:transcriptional regulator with XRE-family HTH domain